MRSRFIKDEMTYTGEQLQSLYALDTFGVAGDSIVSFVGPSDVPVREIVDIDDLKAGRRLQAPKMLHFIAEHFETDLEKTILRQYLLLDILKDLVNERIGRVILHRANNDLVDGDSRLTISTATASPVSCLFHVGINVIAPDNGAAKAKGLSNYNLDPLVLGPEVIERYSREI